MRKLEPFEAPFLKLERARYHFEDLRETLFQFGAAAPLQFVKTTRAESPWQIELSRPFPLVVSLQLSDIVHSLRSSLDVLLCEVANFRNVGLSDMAFPFAIDKAGFDNITSKPPKDSPFKKLGDDIIQIISDIKPYRGGNDTLRALHDLNNQDKHRLLLPVVAAILAKATTPLEKYGIAEKKGVTFLDIMVPLKFGEPISELMYAEVPMDTLVIEGITVTFPEGFVLGGAYIYETMENMIIIVEEILVNIKNAVLK